MSLRKRVGLIVLCVASLTGVGLIGRAQRVDPPLNAPPTILSGTDVGFRVEGRKGDHVFGTLMVRIGGQWFPVGASGRPFPLTIE